MNTYRSRKRREGLQIATYGLFVSAASVGMTYGELTAWDSMIGAVPGIAIWPATLVMGLVVAVMGIKEFFDHR
jgi:hypothetical protein